MVAKLWRSCTKTSKVPLVSLATRLEAADRKATKRPSALMTGPALKLFPGSPALLTLTMVVDTKPGSSKTPSTSVSRSWTKTSPKPLVSPNTRLEASDWKATKRPSALIAMGKARLPLFPWPPALETLTLVVLPVWRSWTKMSKRPLVSPATRLVAKDSKATKRPSALMAGKPLILFASPPALETLTLVVAKVWRSWTKMSRLPLVSPNTRLVAKEWKATTRPSALMAGKPLLRPTSPSLPRTPWSARLGTLTLVVAKVWRSCTKMSAVMALSPVTRLVAKEAKATKRPSALMAGMSAAASLAWFPWVPRVPWSARFGTLTLSVVPGFALAGGRKRSAAASSARTPISARRIRPLRTLLVKPSLQHRPRTRRHLSG